MWLGRGDPLKKMGFFPVWEMMESRARLSWKRQPRVILVIFILPRERQEAVELRASEGALGSQGTRGQRGQRDGLGSKGRRYVWDCPPREWEWDTAHAVALLHTAWDAPMEWGLMFWGPHGGQGVLSVLSPLPFGAAGSQLG